MGNIWATRIGWNSPNRTYGIAVSDELSDFESVFYLAARASRNRLLDEHGYSRETIHNL